MVLILAAAGLLAVTFDSLNAGGREGFSGVSYFGGVAILAGAGVAVSGTPLVVAGPLVRAGELRRAGAPVSAVPGWLAVGLATAGLGGFGASSVTDEPAGLVVGAAGLAAAWASSGVQAVLNDRAFAALVAQGEHPFDSPPRVVVFPAPYPGGLALAGTF